MDTDPLPPEPTPSPGPLRPGFTPEHLSAVLGEATRYRLLGLLIDGSTRSAAELGKTLGKARDNTAKHLTCLRMAGIIELTDNSRDRRTPHYRLVPAFVPPPGAPRVLDFGWCMLRFG